MDLQKQNSTLIRGHIHVARMAYRSGEYHAAYRNLNSALYEIQEARSDTLDDLDRHELKRLFGKVQVALRMYEQAERAFREAIEVGTNSSSVPESAIISDTRHLADCIRLQGRLEEAESLYQGSIDTLEESDSKSENQLPKAYVGLAQVYVDGQKFADAEVAVAEALTRFEHNPGARSFWYGRTLVTLARLRWAQDRTAESKEILQQALTILEPLIGPHHPLRALALRRLAGVLDREGHEGTAKAIHLELKEVEKYLKDHDT